MTDCAEAGGGAGAAATLVKSGEGLDAAAALAGSVAHDLGNMLTVVLGNAELLVEALADQPELSEFAALILDAAQHGSELTGRLYRFARHIPPPAVPIDTAAELASFARRLAATLPPGVVLETEVAPDLRRLLLPASALNAALDELAANARAALPRHGMLRLVAANHQGPAGEPRLRLTMEDEGRGMDPEMLQRHRQLRFASGIAGHRTALGLALAMRVAQAAGGCLMVESTAAMGSRVTLELTALP
ncbi:MAG TPA: ATP-binding protein [Falsiroseomonas sp.]|jgi:signal transduction histidine kinase|nr:ATP-binding protein [Falsiroseomonas sp.]